MGHHRRTAAVLTATLAAALSAAAPVHARTQLDTRATSAALPAAAAAELAVPQRYRAQDLHWQVCDELTGTECAFMTVPRDWHNPGARVDLSIAVSRTQPPDGTATRYVFGNPGGPGGPGLGMAPFLASQPGLGDHVGHHPTANAHGAHQQWQSPRGGVGLLGDDVARREPLPDDLGRRAGPRAGGTAARAASVVAQAVALAAAQSEPSRLASPAAVCAPTS